MPGEGTDKTAFELARIFREKTLDATKFAHLCVDVQKIFAIPEIAVHIAENINPVFNRCGIVNYLIAMGSFDESGMPSGLSAFCAVNPLPGDRVVPKTRASAFGGSNIDSLLKEKGTELVAISGFAFGWCVEQTARDARQYKYETVILSDGVNNDSSHKSLRADLADRGVIFAKSRDFFAALRRA